VQILLDQESIKKIVTLASVKTPRMVTSEF